MTAWVQLQIMLSVARFLLGRPPGLLVDTLERVQDLEHHLNHTAWEGAGVGRLDPCCLPARLPYRCVL